MVVNVGKVRDRLKVKVAELFQGSSGAEATLGNGIEQVTDGFWLSHGLEVNSVLEPFNYVALIKFDRASLYLRK